MRMLVAFVVLIGSMSWNLPASTMSINWDEPARPLPAITFETRDGEVIGPDAFQGRIVVLNLWATWCAPCRLEMPTLAHLQSQFDPEDVQVVALAIDRAPFDDLDAFMAETEATNLTVVRNPDMSVARALQAPGLPATLVLDREGQERFRHLGYADWGTDDVVAALRDLD